MNYKIFTDPYYHSEDFVDFDPKEVVTLEPKTLTLFLRGKYKVTNITLKSGAGYVLEGDVVAEIEAARAQSMGETNT